MSTERVLRFDITRAEQTFEPYKFDAKRQRYILQGPRGAQGEAELDWPEVLRELDELRRAQTPTAIEKPLGLKLRRFLEDALKMTQGWESIEQALRQAQEQKQRLHLVFGFNTVELFALPWALTRLRNGQTLGDHPHCIIQFEWTGGMPSGSALPSGGRLLFAWSEAGDPVPDDGHRQVLTESWPGFLQERDELPDVGLEKLEKVLSEAEESGQPVRILHILCHGGAMPDGTFGLLWSAPASRGGQVRVDGDALKRILAPYKRSLELVVLAACHGADPGRPDRMFGGVAHDLHHLGIPFVIASQMPLSREGSIRMSRALYQALASGRTSVQEAYKEAQSAVSSLFRDWASLQLFAVSSFPPGDERRLLRRSQRTVFSARRPFPELVGDELALAYEVNNPVPSSLILKALKDELSQEPDVLALRPLGGTDDGLPDSEALWKKAFNEAKAFFRAMKEAEVAANRQPRLHVFGRAPLPLMFHLGWLFGRHPLRVYQEPRVQGDTWPCHHDSKLVVGEGEQFLQVKTWPEREACRAAGGRVALTIEVSRWIGEDDLRGWLTDSGYPALIRLAPAGGPSPTAVRGPRDAACAVRDLLACLNRIKDELPEAREVWLAFVCSASFAAALGRAFNPKAQRPLKLFNYRPAEGYVAVHTMGGKVGGRG